MSDHWTLHGREFGNCNCDWGCPCQFNASTTHGFCEAAVGGIVDEGNFNDVSLDGLRWALLLQWPGEIAAGNGRQQAIIDASASAEQRESLRKILHGESTEPGATHFFVYNSTMSEVLETLYLPVEVEIDVEARRGRVQIDGVLESHGAPIVDPNSGEEFRARIDLPNGFEYRVAEMGSGRSRASGSIRLELDGSYAQFNEVHMTQSGVMG